MKHYRSSIPADARERITATFVDSPAKYKAEYRVNGRLVGIRFFHDTGELAWECPLKAGVLHGTEYRADIPGQLLSAEPYRNGLPHGTARQWSDDGRLIGTYRMKHGTGIDFWWCSSGGCRYLTEARYLKNGKWHGFEWWLNPDGKSVYEERHFHENRLHGIERSWNRDGRLRRGYPKYWIFGKAVSKRAYLRASANHPELPPFRERDNQPGRTFPPEVKAHA